MATAGDSGLCPLLWAEIELEQAEAGLDRAPIVEGVDFDVLQLRNVQPAPPLEDRGGGA